MVRHQQGNNTLQEQQETPAGIYERELDLT
jgi:hypothetical protein